ncbi:MAG TPA: response regulator [Terriglobales bacterium]|nr:response regulator [Terriglobales bacterium]
MDPHTVLIIDDEEAGLYVRKLVLEAEGYQVVSALDGMQGLKVFRRQRVDAVITDQVMPGLDGVQVAREIKQQNRRVPVIMLSAIPTEPEGAGAVVDAFVVKGQSPAVLLERLGSLLRIRRHSHEDFDGKYVAFVDQNRKYLDVTDGVCELLGYSRSELLRMRIDDVAAPQEVKNVPPLFERYVSEKSLDGIFRLQNRQGNILRIRYHSRVFPDGCMVARWEPQL